MNSKTRTHRDVVLEGAERILETGTFGELTVDSLARSLRMSKSTLYKFFLSKDLMIDAIVQRNTEGLDGALNAATVPGVLDAVAQLADRLPRALADGKAKLPKNGAARLDQLRSIAVGAAARALGGDAPLGLAIATGAFAAMEQAARDGAPRGDAVRRFAAKLR